MGNITEPLRLARGSHERGTGAGCAMNVISWENGDSNITDFPPCTDKCLAVMVQHINDQICTHAARNDEGVSLLCPECSQAVLGLAHSTVGTTLLKDGWVDTKRTALTHAKIVAELAEEIYPLDPVPTPGWKTDAASLVNLLNFILLEQFDPERDNFPYLTKQWSRTFNSLTDRLDAVADDTSDEEKQQKCALYRQVARVARMLSQELGGCGDGEDVREAVFWFHDMCWNITCNDRKVLKPDTVSIFVNVEKQLAHVQRVVDRFREISQAGPAPQPSDAEVAKAVLKMLVKA